MNRVFVVCLEIKRLRDQEIKGSRDQEIIERGHLGSRKMGLRENKLQLHVPFYESFQVETNISVIQSS